MPMLANAESNVEESAMFQTADLSEIKGAEFAMLLWNNGGMVLKSAKTMLIQILCHMDNSFRLTHG